MWYTYFSAEIYKDAFGVPRTLILNGTTPDDEFLSHAWLVETYPNVLRGMRSADPLFDYRDAPHSLHYGETEKRIVVELETYNRSVQLFMQGHVAYVRTDVGECVIALATLVRQPLNQ